ncbi:MAG: protoporphyrinogen oxidase [Blautia sp.]|nr:protoporphyrinogen oxidase [Blautia sp.]
MADKKEAQNLQGSDFIAELFGLTTRRVQQLTNDGVIFAVKEGNAYKYDLLPTIRKYVKYLSDKANGRDKKDEKEEQKKARAEADLKRAKADMAEIQLKELKGQMHRSEDVEALTSDLVYTIRSMIIALPGRLAVDVAAVSTAPEASEIIRRECFAILEELSNYKYDPEEYARRVRDREGWQDISDGDDE